MAPLLKTNMAPSIKNGEEKKPAGLLLLFLYCYQFVVNISSNFEIIPRYERYLAAFLKFLGNKAQILKQFNDI